MTRAVWDATRTQKCRKVTPLGVTFRRSQRSGHEQDPAHLGTPFEEAVGLACLVQWKSRVD